MGTQKETCVPEGVFIFSTWRVLGKKNQSFLIKTHNCEYGTFAEHQNLCWRYLSRDSNWSLRTPDYVFIFSEEFSFTVKIITQ